LGFYGTLQPLANPKAFRSFPRTLFSNDWVVYAKPPFGGPQHVLQYLARYTHRVAISNHRLLSFADGKVAFRWKDYAHGNKKRKMTLTAEEFLRRFLLHVLPRGFVRIRHFGFMANRQRTERIALCRQLLPATRKPCVTAVGSTPAKLPTWNCPICGGPMVVNERLSVRQIRLRAASKCAPRTLFTCALMPRSRTTQCLPPHNASPSTHRFPSEWRPPNPLATAGQPFLSSTLSTPLIQTP